MKTAARCNRTAALILTLCMLFSFLSLNAGAAGAKKTSAAFRNPPLRSTNYPRGNVSRTADWNGLIEFLYQTVKAHKTKVDILKYKVPTDDDSVDYFFNVVFTTPKLLSLITDASYYSDPKGQYIQTVELTYRYSKAGCAQVMDYCGKAVAKMTSDLKANPYLSDADKVLLVHDRLASLAEYDYANYLDEEAGLIDDLPEEDYNPYGPLALWSGVCDGYSESMSLCLEALGIKSYVVNSKALHHSWNIVYLNGVPYFVDTTWDDPPWDICGQVYHDNLLVSTSKLKQNHTASDYVTTPVSTYYDNYYWTNSSTAFQLIGDYLYYIDNVNETLCRRNYDGTSTVLKDLDYTWYTDGGTARWRSNFCRLASYAGWLIYSTPTQVYGYNVYTGETTLLYSPYLNTAKDYYIYGMTVKNCMLYLDVNNDPDFDRNTKAQTEYRIELSHLKRNVPETRKTYCTDTGYTAGTVCEICGKVFSGRAEIAPTAHVWGEQSLQKKASVSKDGTYVRTCRYCPAKQETALPKASKISLSATKYVYDGKVKKPSVVVKDSKGNEIPSQYYTITRSNPSSKAIGSYTVTVQFKGKYTGSKVLTYMITPGRVKKLKQTKVKTTEISMEWSAAANAACYRVEISEDNGKTWYSLGTVSRPAVTVTELDPGVKYQFRVCSLDSTKKIAAKPSAALKTQALCKAPKITKITSTGSGGVYVEWKKVTGASNYAVYWSTDAKNWRLIDTDTGKYMYIQGYNVDGKVYLAVRAINAYGKYSAYSAAKSVLIQY